jgi:glycosyltransferase involved in cell wall biosynthesis
MKINFISYFDPREHRGGGEMISMDIINEGLRRGHTFTYSSVRPSRLMSFDDNADLDLVVDLFNYPHTLKSLGAWLDFPESFKSKIMQRPRMAHMSNAYTDLCNLPYLPCSGNASPECPQKKSISLHEKIANKDFGERCFATQSWPHTLYSKAKLNIFLSPLHRDISLRVLNLNNPAPTFILKPTIDATQFFNQKRSRDIDYLFVGVIGEAKGLEEMRRRYKNANIHLAGKLHPKAQLDFGTYHGSVAYNEIPALMNRAQNFVFLPRWPEPQGRVVIEAALCGCNLITNQNVGATSFAFDIRDASNFNHATSELWQALEGL